MNVLRSYIIGFINAAAIKVLQKVQHLVIIEQYGALPVMPLPEKRHETIVCLQMWLI